MYFNCRFLSLNIKSKKIFRGANFFSFRSCIIIILFGYGWGLSATLFEHTSDSSSINKLIHLVEKFPDEKIDQVKAGVRFSFDSSVTPVLDKNVLFELEKKGF